MSDNGKVVGWHWHRWTKWSAGVQSLHHVSQQRTCIVCGKIRMRQL